MIRDAIGRQFKTLRLSLTSKCNFACLYCVPNDSTPQFSQEPAKPLAPEKHVEWVKKINHLVGLKAVKLTGGEPTFYKPIIKLISMLKEAGIPRVHLTTNATHLTKLSPGLKQAGLDSINVSLDAVNQDVFSKINSKHHKLKNVLNGIESALDVGLKVKINCTIMKNINDNQVLPVFEYGTDRGISVRFLELMKMGHLFHNHNIYFFSEKKILDKISQKYDFSPMIRTKSSTSKYWVTTDNREFGIISNHSSPFCDDCDKLRLDSQEKIYGCLSSSKRFSLKEKDTNLNEILSLALKEKQDHAFKGSALSMKYIGG